MNEKNNAGERVGFWLLIGLAFFLGGMIFWEPRYGLYLLFTAAVGFICYKAHELGLLWILEALFFLGIVAYFLLSVFGVDLPFQI